jgi:hypothetical protein
MSENIKRPEILTQTPASSDPLSLDTSLLQAAEARMRRALGLEGGAPRPRPQERAENPARPAERFTPGHKRRFVQDGEVPVTVVGGRRDAAAESGASRLEAVEAALNAEQAARQQAERTLAETQSQLHDVQTKLGHAEIARSELQSALRREQETIAALRTELLQAQEERAAVLSAAKAARARPRPPAEDPESETGSDALPSPRRRAGRTRVVTDESDSKLVRWWLKKTPDAE